MNRAKITHNVHGIRHSTYDLHGQKDGTRQAEVMMRMACCEVITRTASRQIAVRSEIETHGNTLIHTWFAGNSIPYDPAAVSYCG